MNYQQIIQAVLQEDSSLPHELIYDQNKTRVYRIDLSTPIILRMIEGDSASQEYRIALQAELAADDDLTSKILYCETREIENKPFSIQIQTFIPGEPVTKYPDEEESQSIVHAVYTLHQRLSQAAEKIGTDSAASIHALITQLLPAVRDCPIKTAAEGLMVNSRYLELINQPDQTLIYGDLWYKNLLLEKHGSETTVRFVDIDPLVLGPAILQPAILFSSYFLFTKLLFEPDEVNSLNLQDYFSYWPESVDEFDMLLMMLVFPVGLGLLKEFQLSQDSGLDPEIRKTTLKRFEESIEFLQRYIAACKSSL